MFKVEIAKGKVIEVNFDAMPQNAKDYIIAYGLKQKLNDAGASITKDEVPEAEERLAQKVAVAEVALKALLSGDITTRQGAAAQTLEEREASKWLKAKYKEIFKEKIGEMPDSSDDFLAKGIAEKLGISVEILWEKLEPLAAKLAEKQRAINALKSAPEPEIEF